MNEQKLRRYLNAYIIYEMAKHNIDPRVQLIGTDLRLYDNEGYKYVVFEQCRRVLEESESYVDNIEKLLSGHNLVDYHQIMKVADLARNAEQESENALELLYRTDNDQIAFERIKSIFGGKYDVIAFLFFIKDIQKYLPLSPQNFDDRFHRIDVELKLSGNCSWVNYNQFLNTLKSVMNFLRDNLNNDITLLDAHSFIWILPYLDDYLKSEIQLVEHKKWGKGIVAQIDEKYIYIKFGKEIKMFSRESAFEKYLKIVPLELDIYGNKTDREVKNLNADEYKLLNEPRISSVDEWIKILQHECRYHQGFNFVENVLLEIYKVTNYTIFCKTFEKEKGIQGLNLRVGEFRDRIKKIEGVKLEEQLREDSHTDRAWNIPFRTNPSMNVLDGNGKKFSWVLREELIEALEIVYPEIKKHKDGTDTDESISFEKETFLEKEVAYSDAEVYLQNESVLTGRLFPKDKKHAPKKDYLKIQRRNKEIGDLGEEKIVLEEKRLLTEAGRSDLAEMVHIVDSDDYGYDVKSYNVDGSKKHIEVKTSFHASKELVFYISAYEVSQMLEDPAYELQYICGINDDKIQIIKFNQKQLKDEVIKKYMVPIQYEVRIPQK